MTAIQPPERGAALEALNRFVGTWTMEASFPDFGQRFSPDRDTIRGAREKAEPGAGWTHDFDLSYTRLE